MCDATSLVTLGLGLAGGLVNMQQQNAAVSAQNKQNRLAMQLSQEAADAERERQRGFETESFDQLRKAMDAADDLARGKPQAEVEERLASETEERAPELTVSSLPGQVSGDTELARVVGGEIADRAADTSNRIKALATLTGQGSGFSGLGDILTGTGSQIGSINSKRRGSAAVGQREANVIPGQVRASSNPLGDILLLGSQAVGSGLLGGLGGGGLTAAQRAANAAQTAPIYSPIPRPRPVLPL